MVTDSNVVAQEKGASAVADFVRYGGKGAGSTRETILPAVVEKCLGSTRAGTKQKGLELVLLYAENEDVMGSEGVVMDVLAGIAAKQPKLVAGSVTALKDLIKDFGPKQVKPNAILKKLPDIFGHSDKTVRAEGVLLALELHRYLGAALEPTIDALKDIQAKELRAQFQEMDASGQGKPVPPRNLFSQKAAAEAAAAAASGARAGESEAAVAGPAAGFDEAEGAEEFDAYEMAEPVDPLKVKEWPDNFEEQVKSAKWSERKEAFEAAKQVLTTHIKLQPGNAFDSFVETCLERIKKDATVHVWLMACQCLEAAAKGMRGGFAKYRERTMPPLLEKLKEKKQSTVDVLAATLDAIFQTVTISDILEDTLAATKHKNPSVKTESIRFLVRCLRTTTKPPAKNDIKPVADALLAACSDGSGDVRDAGTQGLGTLMKLIGERPMNPYLEQLDDIKKGKVMDEFKNAIVKVRMGGAAAPPPARPAAAPVASRPAAAAPPKARMPVKPSAADKENAPPSGSQSASPSKAAAPVRSMAAPPRKPVAPAAPTSSASSKAAAARPPIARPAAGPSKGAAAGMPSVNEPVKFRFTPEDAEARAAELIPGDIAKQLADSNWKERLAGIQAFAGWLDREAESIESEVVIRALSKKPGWKESNFQVMGEVFKVLKLLSEQCPTFGRSSVALSVQPLCDKLGDIKLKGPAGETLSAYSEKTSFAFVLKQALGPLAALKAPKAIADSLAWLDGVLLEFGIQGVDVRSLVDHLLTCLKSANAAVRNNATTTMGTLARYLGPALNAFLTDLNLTLKTTIEGEIDKASSKPPPAPVKFSGELKSAAGAGNADDGASKEAWAAAAADEEDALDALIPRVDIDKLVPGSAIAAMGDANWKVRKEALEEIQGILQANTRLKGTLSDLAPALKLRYLDSNIQCKTMALDIAGKLATGLGKNFEPQARTFVTPVSLCLSDAKAPLRLAAATTLTAIADAVGASAMIAGFASALESKGANPQMKQDLFAWLAARFEASPPDKSYDLAPLALPAVQCLDDKLAAVKKSALATLPYIIQRAGYKFVSSQADTMKTASKNTVLPLIDQARTTANSLAKPAAGPPAVVPAPSVVPASKVAPGIKRATSAAAPPRPASPAGRAASPSPYSPQAASTTSRIGGSVRPPSAATRTLHGAIGSGTRVASAPSVANGASSVARPAFGSRLGVAKKATMAPTSATASSQGYAAGSGADKSAPFTTADSKWKLAREKKEPRGQHWITAEGTAQPSLVETLRAQCDPHMGASMLDSMFSKDHNAERDYLSALTLLSDLISSPTFAEEEYGIAPAEAVARVVANSDLILKYIAIRLTDNNTSISLKCFDVLSHLVDLLRAEQYHMSDYEANAILPCLIAKFGDAKQAFRDRIRDTFRKLTFIFPPSKLMTQYLENGLPHKNARTRSECLAELGYLFSKNGLQVCTPSKTLPIIAKQISDRDTNVRTAALLALGECYKIVGDEIWDLVGKLPDKEMSLLEERLKRTVVSRPASAIAGPSSPKVVKTVNRAASGIVPPGALKSRLPAGIPRAGPRSSILAASQAVSSPASRSAVSNGASRSNGMQQTQDSSELQQDEDGQPDIRQTIHEVLSSEEERSTIALKTIHAELLDNPAPLASHADQIAIVVAKQFARAFKEGTASADPEVARLKKYLIQVSSCLFDSRSKSAEGVTLAAYIQRSALAALMTQLLQRLIDCSNNAKDDGESKTYATYLNKIVLRCFGSCDLNVLYSTSFTMLADASEDLRELPPATLKTRVDFAELIIKCLWKVGRRLPTSLEERAVDPAQLLFDLEAFLQRIPPAEWKARAQDGIAIGDLPLRTIRVILTHVISALGDDVFQQLDKIENPEEAYIYEYLVKMINRTTDSIDDDADDLDDMAGGQQPAKRATPKTSSGSLKAPSSPSTRSSVGGQRDSLGNGKRDSSDDATASELKSIFERISQKDQSRQAIKDLYEFQKRHPEKVGQIERSLQMTGPIFQRYIKRALANHQAEDEAAGSNDTAMQSSDVPQSPKRTTSANGSPASTGLGRPTSAAAGSSPMASPRPSVAGLQGGDGHVRSASSTATEERLKALRAKFYNKKGGEDGSGEVAAAGPTSPGGGVD